MPQPKEICIEDLAEQALGRRYLRCVALGGRQPGLRLDARGEILWQSDDAIACELWVSQDERLVLYRPAGAREVRVARAGRSLDVPHEKPVILVDQDEVTVGARALRVHFHGAAAEVHAPAFVPEALLRGARGLGLAAALGASLAGCDAIGGGARTGGGATNTAPPPIEVRDHPPAVAPMPMPEPTTSVSAKPPAPTIPR